MLFGLIKPSEYGYLLSYISPGFLDVVPPNSLFQAVRDLALKGRNRSQFEKWMSDRRASLKQAKLPVNILNRKETDREPYMALQSLGQINQRKHIGHSILQLFFHQLFDGGATLLDLRSDTFWVDDKMASDQIILQWMPRCLFVNWQPDFIKPVRQLYRGFYEDDMTVFDQALTALNLDPTRDVLLEFFGNARDTEMRFMRSAFLDQFKRIFTICKQEKRSIHPQFVVLGAYLAGLYDALEQLNVPLDVGNAFRELEFHNEPQKRPSL